MLFNLDFSFSPEVWQTDVDWRSSVRIISCLVLTPRCPDLLACWVHYHNLGVTSFMDTCSISVNKFWSNFSVVLLQKWTKAWIVGWLQTFVVEENTVHLWMSVIKWSDPRLVIVEFDPIFCIISASKAVVRCWSPSKMYHHSSVSRCQSLFNVGKVITKLNSIS